MHEAFAMNIPVTAVVSHAFLVACRHTDYSQNVFFVLKSWISPGFGGLPLLSLPQFETRH